MDASPANHHPIAPTYFDQAMKETMVWLSKTVDSTPAIRQSVGCTSIMCPATASPGACCRLGLLGRACLRVDVPFTAVLRTCRRHKSLLTRSMSVLSYGFCWVRPHAMMAAAVCICPSTTGAVSCRVCLCSGCVCWASTAVYWSFLSMRLDSAGSRCLPLWGLWCSCGLCCLHPTASALP